MGVVPHPRLRVDGLAHCAQHPQGGEVVAFGLLSAPFHEGPDGSGGRVELGDPVALDDVPEPVLGPLGLVAVSPLGPWGVRGAFVDDRGTTVGQWSVDDVAVAGDPADVGCTPVDVGIRAEVEHVSVGVGHLSEVAARGVHDPLGFGCRARRVQQVEELFAVHRFGRAVGRGIGYHVVPPQVPAVDHGHLCVAAVDDHHVLDRRGPAGQRGVHIGLQRRRGAATVAGVRGDDEPGLGVLASVHDGVGREAPEDDAVGHPDASTGQHGYR